MSWFPCGWLKISRCSISLAQLCECSKSTPLEDIFKIGASAAASKLSEWVLVKISVYIPHCKYQAKSHSSPWFSADCTAVIVHRNHFFHLYQENKSSESKVKFRQASNQCKRAWKDMLLKQKSVTSQKLGSQDFWQIANK